MLEKINLNQKLQKSEFIELMNGLEKKLGELQRQAQKSAIPIIIVFEGWDAAGKGTLINRLLRALDPRGIIVHPINPPNLEEKHNFYQR